MFCIPNKKIAKKRVAKTCKIKDKNTSICKYFHLAFIFS